MDIVVCGRNVEVPDHYRRLVADKLGRIERYDHKLIRIYVELQHERNRRQASACQHVEITCKSRGPVVRAEACAADFYKALDAAVAKLQARLRRAADRRRVHYGQHRRASVADAVGKVDAAPVEALNGGEAPSDADGSVNGAEVDMDVTTTLIDETTGQKEDDGPGRIVRRKEHTAVPMTVDQALHEMELVGHDFYLFADAESGLPSVVYRRKGYHYGVIRLRAPVTRQRPPAPRRSPEFAASS